MYAKGVNSVALMEVCFDSVAALAFAQRNVSSSWPSGEVGRSKEATRLTQMYGPAAIRKWVAAGFGSR